MGLPKTVTAQDFDKFKDAIIDAEVEYERKLDEANSMDDDDIAEKADDKWHNAIRRIYDSVRQEARREALKEMDEARIAFHNASLLIAETQSERIWKEKTIEKYNNLFKEYNQP